MEIQIFSKEQQRAIEEKTEQLKRIREGSLKPKELASMITERRLSWLKENRHLLRNDLPLPEAAYRLLVFDHMGVDDNLLIAKCKHFCPYLEACKKVKVGTEFVCKEIGEPSIVEFMKEINPRLSFDRDYGRIRPYWAYCLEYVRLEEQE